MSLRAVVSDVHSNLDALRAVLRDISRRGAEEVVFLGDAVGYGPEPNECVALLAESCRVMIAGNHDWGALGLEDTAYFNPAAREAIGWTAGVLGPEARQTLRALPLTANLSRPAALLVHSSPLEPSMWHYISGAAEAERYFGLFAERVCLVGHSHRPFIAETGPSGGARDRGISARFGDDSRYIINVGSVGQPRDGDPRACYALLGEDRAELVRVRYPIESTQGKMKRAGLPQSLIDRLAAGR